MLNKCHQTKYNTMNELIQELKVQFPYNETMCKDKYNETILDYLYEEIVVELTN